MDAETRQELDLLKKEIASLRQMVSPATTPKDRTKPINYKALDAAIDAFARGDRKPLQEYRKLYRIT